MEAGVEKEPAELNAEAENNYSLINQKLIRIISRGYHAQMR